MHTRIKIIVGIGATLVLVGFSLFIFLYYLATKSFPRTDGSLKVAGLTAEVNVYRDEYGVPHIFAQSEHDLYFTVGFIHAQDRLWQMELARRAGTGTLAEVLGEPAVKFDKLFRTIGIATQAHAIAASLDEKTRAPLQAYADGVTSFIRLKKGSYPVEFDLLNIEPAPWTIEHSLIISRLMGWELNYSRWVDITLGELVEKFGEAKAAEIFPTWPEGTPIIVPEGLRGKRVASLAKDFLRIEQEYREFAGSPGLQTGSNAWAVSGSKSVTGKPLLANDPHLMFTVPGRWYELHAVAPGIDVAGASIAGVPFVILGRNQHIAWGVTNAMLDDEDFYVEQVDSVQHPTQYRFNNSWRPIEQHVDTILVKDSAPILLTVYRTHRGPIINRIEPSAQFSRTLLSMRWTGQEISNEAQTFYELNKASNWSEFENALKHFAVPAQNFVYADVEGNIGYRTAGIIPIRTSKSPTLPFPGWTSDHDWKGFVPFDEMPHVLNPPEGFIATANNKIVTDSYPYYVSNLWEPHWRITRITELLKTQPKCSVEDFQRFQLDVFSTHAREIVPLILKSYEGKEVNSPDVQTALNYFRTWNFEMKKENVATTLFEVFFVNMIHNTFEDEMGADLLAVYDTLASLPLSVTTKLMVKGSSPWFDNVKTLQTETMNDLIHQSMDDAINGLKKMYGGELKEWQWGKLHYVEFPHIFGGEKILKPVFNLGPFPTGGSHATLNKGDYPLGGSFVHYVGPSTRQIFDLADPDNGRAVTPAGQSGQVFQRHYDDQLQLWLAGGYRHWVMSREKIENSNYNYLVLKPTQ